jgi:hypothetical protein
MRFLADGDTGDVLKYGSLHRSGQFDDMLDSSSHLLFPETITCVVTETCNFKKYEEMKQ